MALGSESSFSYQPGVSPKRGTRSLIGQRVLSLEELPFAAPPSNFIVEAPHPDLQWVADATERIGAWRDLMRSTYVQWCVAINGLHVAAAQLSRPEWQIPARRFIVNGVRPTAHDRSQRAVIADFSGPDAARAHMDTINKLATWGFVELLGMFEDLVFDLYRIYLWGNPGDLINNNRGLKQLWRRRMDDGESLEAWTEAFSEALDKWQKKKGYLGLHRVFLTFFQRSGLREHEVSRTTPEDWARSLRLLATVRNAIVHGQQSVTREVVEALDAARPYHLGLSFKEGEPLELDVNYLGVTELFADQLLTAINLSLVQAAVDRREPAAV